MATAPQHILTILAVENLEAATDFYQRGFGWEVRVDAPVYVEFALPDGRGLGIYERESFAVNTGRPAGRAGEGKTSGTELYFYCDDLDAAISRLKAAGAEQLSALAERPWGDMAAYFADPVGNVLVLAKPLSRAR